jgi:hypothetical protein
MPSAHVQRCTVCTWCLASRLSSTNMNLNMRVFLYSRALSRCVTGEKCVWLRCVSPDRCRRERRERQSAKPVIRDVARSRPRPRAGPASARRHIFTHVPHHSTHVMYVAFKSTHGRASHAHQAVYVSCRSSVAAPAGSRRVHVGALGPRIVGDESAALSRSVRHGDTYADRRQPTIVHVCCTCQLTRASFSRRRSTSTLAGRRGCRKTLLCGTPSAYPSC